MAPFAFPAIEFLSARSSVEQFGPKYPSAPGFPLTMCVGVSASQLAVRLLM